MNSYTRLSQLLSGYPNTGRQPDTAELQRCLRTATPESRYELIKAVRVWPGTAIHRAAFLGHKETLSCILDSFTAEEKYKLLMVQHGGDRTALHWAAFNGHVGAMRCMLDKASPEHQIQLLNTRDDVYKTPLDLALSENKPETAALIHQYIETAKKNIKEKQERKQDLNNADSQRGLKRKIVDFKQEVPRLRAKLEEQEVFNQQRDQQIEVLRTTVEVHGVQLQQEDKNIATLQQKIIDMETKWGEIKGKVSQLQLRVRKNELAVQKAIEELPVLAATTEVHGVQLQQHDVKITTLQQQGNEMKINMVELKGDISQVKQQTQEHEVNIQNVVEKVPVLTATTKSHGVQLQQHEVKISGEEVEEEDIDRGIHVIDN